MAPRGKNIVLRTPWKLVRSASSTEDHTPGAPGKSRKDEDDEVLDLNEDQLEMQKKTLEKKRQSNHRSWPHVDPVREETIVQKLKEYRDQYRDTYKFVDDDDDPPVEDLHNILQVEDMSPEDVCTRILKLLASAPTLGFPVPSRKAKDIHVFNETLDSWLLRGGKDFRRGRDKRGSDTYNITHALLTQIYELCVEKQHMEIREIYYSNTKLYKNVKTVSAAIDDVCCMVRCTRKSLYVTVIENGLIYGDITFTLDGKDFNGRSCGSRGVLIPPNVGSVTNIRCNSTKKEDEPYCVIVVEKDTVFQRLVEDGFCDKYRCILISGRGMPSVDTRIALRIISIALRLPVFALMDGNPYGLRIYSVYRYGSKKMSYDRDNLVTPNIQLLGMRYSDIDTFEIPAAYIEKMKNSDRVTAKKLMERQHLKDYHGHLYLRSMIEKRKKIQIEALHCRGLRYLAEVALPMMLEEKLIELMLEAMTEEKTPTLIETLPCHNLEYWAAIVVDSLVDWTGLHSSLNRGLVIG